MTDLIPTDGFANVQGRCPACHGASLFLGSGGYVTCARLDCPEPDAASTLLETRTPAPAEVQAAGGEVGPTPAGTVDKPDDLRERYAAAIHNNRFPESSWDCQPSWIQDDYRATATAVIAVRDHELEQLAEAAQWNSLRYADAQAELQQLRAELAALKTIARGYCPACGRGDCAPTADQWQEQKRRAVKAEAALERVRKLHQPMLRGALTVCAHCSGWDEKRQRCFGVLTEHPCDTLRALDPQEPTAPAVHIGGRANAENCPACAGTNPPYPFICPGPEETP